MALGAMLGVRRMVTFPGSERTFYGICLGFWSFFAIRAWRAVRWRRSGLGGRSTESRRDCPQAGPREQKGSPPGCPCRHLSREVPAPNPKSFLESMEQQFWVVGGDRIHVGRRPKNLVFGKQLDPETPSSNSFNARLQQALGSVEEGLITLSNADPSQQIALNAQP